MSKIIITQFTEVILNYINYKNIKIYVIIMNDKIKNKLHF